MSFVRTILGDVPDDADVRARKAALFAKTTVDSLCTGGCTASKPAGGW